MNISETNNPSATDIYNQATFTLTISIPINLFLSIPMNIYVLWLIVNGVGGTMTSEIFALNLSVSEILFCLVSVFFLLNKQIQTFSLEPLCTGGISLLFTSRPLFQSCICVERYLAVVHPVTFLKYKPLRYRVGCCSVAWLKVLLDSTINIFLLGRKTYHYIYIVQYLILFFVMLFCCLSVLRALKQPGPGEGDKEGANKTKRRAFKIILIIFVATIFSYLPMSVILFLVGALHPVVWYMSYCIGLSITLLNGFLQPLLYLHRAGKLPGIRAL